MKFAFASLVAFATAAIAATNGPYNLGAAADGIEKGVLNTTISCAVTAIGLLPLGNFDIGLGVYATLPNKVAANQPFNILLATRLTTPANLNALSGFLGAAYYDGILTKVEVNAAGSTPSVIDIAKTNNLTIPRAPNNAKGVSILEMPGNNKTVTAGPFKGSNSTGISNVIFSVGNVEGSISTYDKTGKKTFLTANVKCAAARRPTSLAFINAGGKGSTTLKTPKGNGIIQTVPADSTAGVVGLTYTCDFSGFITGKVRISVGGVKKTNKAVASGSQFSISQGQGNVYLSQALISEITSRFDIAKKFAVELNNLDFLAENATPATLNALPNGYKSSIAPLSSKTIITVPEGAPAQTLPDITFTAGASGKTALISLGGTSGTAYIYTQDNEELLNIGFTCASLDPATALLPFDIA